MSTPTNGNSAAIHQVSAHDDRTSIIDSPSGTQSGDSGDLEKQPVLPNGNAAPIAHQDPAKPPKDPNLIEFEDLDPSLNPMNWAKGYKWMVSLIMALMTLSVTFASSMFSTASTVTAEEFGVGQEVTVLGTSLYVLVSHSTSTHPKATLKQPGFRFRPPRLGAHF